MKKLLYALLILFFTATLWAADQNVYLDNAGSGAGSEGDPYGALSEINWSTGGTYSIYDWVVAGDDVYINLARGAIWREELTWGTSGVSAHYVNLRAYGTGARPIIKTTDIVDSWTLQSQETGYAVYRGGPGTSGRFFGAVDNGATQRNPQHFVSGTVWSNYTDDRMVNGYDNTGYHYIRTDGTGVDPGSVNIGTRQFGILIDDKDYITIKDIELHGPQGDATELKDCSLIEVRNGSTNIIVDDVTFKYACGIASAVRGTLTSDVTYKNNNFDHNWGCIYLNTQNLSSDATILIEDNSFTNTSTTQDAQGDRFVIGSWRTRGIKVLRNYINGQGYTGMPGTLMDAAITFADGYNIEVSWNLITAVAKAGISWGPDVAGTHDDIILTYNIIDDYAKYPVDAINDTHGGILIKNVNDSAYHVGGFRVYGNLALNANSPGAGSNHSAFYINTVGMTMDSGFHIHNNIGDNNDGMDYEMFISGNSWTDYSVNNNCFYQDGDSVSAWGTAQTVAEFNALHANFNDNIATTPDLDANYHLGASTTCAGTGYTLDAAYDDGIDEDTTWSPLSVSTAPQPTPWDIGAFIYGTQSAGWTGKIGGVTNPAKIMGVDNANIKSIMGVE